MSESKPIQARRELAGLARLILREKGNAERAARPDALLRVHEGAIDFVHATLDYLKGMETFPMALPVLRVAPRPPLVKEGDYDHFIGFVCQFIDGECGFEVHVQAAPLSATGENPAFLAETDAQRSVMGEAYARLWDRFLAEVSPTEPPPETLRESGEP